MNRPLCVLALACGAVLAPALWAYWLYLDTHVTRVRIDNVSDHPLEDVSLYAGRHSWRVGRIPARGRAHARIDPPVESNLQVGFTTPGGERRVADAGGYFGPGVAADFAVEMDASGIISTDFRYR